MAQACVHTAITTHASSTRAQYASKAYEYTWLPPELLPAMIGANFFSADSALSVRAHDCCYCVEL